MDGGGGGEEEDLASIQNCIAEPTALVSASPKHSTINIQASGAVLGPEGAAAIALSVTRTWNTYFVSQPSSSFHQTSFLLPYIPIPRPIYPGAPSRTRTFRDL